MYIFVSAHPSLNRSSGLSRVIFFSRLSSITKHCIRLSRVNAPFTSRVNPSHWCLSSPRAAVCGRGKSDHREGPLTSFSFLSAFIIYDFLSRLTNFATIALEAYDFRTVLLLYCSMASNGHFCHCISDLRLPTSSFNFITHPEISSRNALRCSSIIETIYFDRFLLKGTPTSRVCTCFSMLLTLSFRPFQLMTQVSIISTTSHFC